MKWAQHPPIAQMFTGGRGIKGGWPEASEQPNPRPRHTCERVSSPVAEAVHCSQHLLLGVEGLQVPLGLGGSTVLSQTWGWTLVAGLRVFCFVLFFNLCLFLQHQGASMLGKGATASSMPGLFKDHIYRVACSGYSLCGSHSQEKTHFQGPRLS